MRGFRFHSSCASFRRARFNGPEGLSSVRLDGSDLRRELVVKARSPSQYVGVPTGVDEVRLNPAGDRALVRYASELFLVDAPPANGATPEVNLETPTVGVTRVTRVGADFFDWAEDGRTYSLSLFIVKQHGGQWETTERRTRSRALRRAELDAALGAAGFTHIRWHEPPESGFYQPIVTARR